ncbi:MAG: hypothetical protein E7638_02385 [Ruminococcaceae bacterium]|nr:hypothetical protein [Oscillospiraceae bacterium]
MSAENKAAKQTKKKKMLIGIIVVALLGGVSWILTENPQLFEKEENGPTSMYSDEIKSYLFYPADYDLDVKSDKAYMEMNRYVYYKNGAETIAITDGDYGRHGAVVEFFGLYFETVIRGNARTYNTFFTDHYYKTNTPYDQFTPQMLYDILIEQLSVTENQNKTYTYAFNVSYKIHKNTGTFRNDIDSDTSKVLYFELIEYPDGRVLIDRITYYK